MSVFVPWSSIPSHPLGLFSLAGITENVHLCSYPSELIGSDSDVVVGEVWLIHACRYWLARKGAGGMHGDDQTNNFRHPKIIHPRTGHHNL